MRIVRKIRVFPSTSSFTSKNCRIRPDLATLFATDSADAFLTARTLAVLNV
jgi:hypothetical protein